MSIAGLTPVPAQKAAKVFGRVDTVTFRQKNCWGGRGRKRSLEIRLSIELNDAGGLLDKPLIIYNEDGSEWQTIYSGVADYHQIEEMTVAMIATFTGKAYGFVRGRFEGRGVRDMVNIYRLKSL